MRRLLFLLAPTTLAASFAVSATGNEPAPSAMSGEQLYEQRCVACHDDRGYGTRIISRRVAQGEAALLDRTNLTKPFVTTVVRRGLGSMPAIREAELSDAQLELIAAFLEGSQ